MPRMLPAIPPPPPLCEMCGDFRAAFEFCDNHHLEGTQWVGARRQYFATTKHGDTASPHLHRICRQCGYEWTQEIVGDA